MREILTLTVEVPLWFGLPILVLYIVHEWAQGYRDKLANELIDLTRRTPEVPCPVCEWPNGIYAHTPTPTPRADAQ